MYYTVVKVKPENESPRILFFSQSRVVVDEYISSHLLFDSTRIATVDSDILPIRRF